MRANICARTASIDSVSYIVFALGVTACGTITLLVVIPKFDVWLVNPDQTGEIDIQKAYEWTLFIATPLVVCLVVLTNCEPNGYVLFPFYVLPMIFPPFSPENAVGLHIVHADFVNNY